MKHRTHDTIASVKRVYIQAIAVMVLICIVAYYAPILLQNDAVTSLVNRFGLIGVFLIALVSGFNLVVPIPAVVFVPLFVASGLGYLPVVVTIALGMTSGDVLGYAIGAITRSLVSERVTSGRIARMVHWAENKNKKAPYILLFFYAMLAPGPNELIVIPMAFLGYRLKYIFPIVFIGNIFFVIIGAFGMEQLINLF